MKIFGVFVFFLSFCMFGCGINKDEYNKVVSENQQLKEEILQLEDEITKLKETDQFYYQSGAEEFANGKFEEAIEWMNNLKLKFPQSTLITSSDNLIIESKNAIAKIYQEERQNFDFLIRDIEKTDIEDAMEKLELYISESHPNDLIKSAKEKLEIYAVEFEKIRNEREIESKIGVRLVDYSTGWSRRSSGNRITALYKPVLTLKFKNISDNPVKPLFVNVDFLDTSKSEVVAKNGDHAIGSGGTPLQSGYTITSHIEASIEYTSWSGDISMLPSLVADIYINDQFYRRISISKIAR
jgi:predicted translin family RNA/ssDNA-binding protein